VVDMAADGVVEAAGTASGNHARCIPSHAQAVARRRRCLSSHAVTSRYIAATATSHKARATQATADHAGNPMSEIRVNPGDSFELALKRFNRKVQQDGILSEARRRSHYESPQARRKRKAEAQSRRRRRTRQPG
jgi:small subunit ribosomal protein S21